MSQEEIEEYGRDSRVVELDMTSRFIGSSLPDRSSGPVRAKMECCKSRDHFGCRFTDGSVTRTPLSSLWFATHSQQVVTFGWGEGLTSLQRCSRRILHPHSTRRFFGTELKYCYDMQASNINYHKSIFVLKILLNVVWSSFYVNHGIFFPFRKKLSFKFEASERKWLKIRVRLTRYTNWTLTLCPYSWQWMWNLQSKCSAKLEPYLCILLLQYIDKACFVKP